MSHKMLSLNGMKRWTLHAIFSALICFPFQGFSQGLLFDQRPANFVDVAKKGIPAVVLINVKITKRNQGLSPHSQGRNREQEDSFNDEFFQHFFGKQRREQRQQAPQERQQMGRASGFLFRNDGYILTNRHVVKDADEIEVILNDGQEFEGELIGVDPHTDIAVVKIDSQNLPYLPLGDSDALEVGQWVVAIGNPLGLQASVTAGIVSAKGRNNLELARIEDFIQTDAVIYGGNSGGPLLNLSGEAIGMNTAIVKDVESGGYVGIGFAIPSNLIKHIMEQLISSGSVTRGFMGVTLQEINQNLAEAFNLEKIGGALVADVSPDSPAGQAGIRQGDVILEYNGNRVTNISALRNAVSMMKPGSKIQLTILRDGEKSTLTFDVGSFPGEEIQRQGKNTLGIKVEALTPEIAKHLGYGEETKGVVVASIESNSPAAWAGIRNGILIVSVNRKEVTSSAEFYRALNEAKKGEPILLLVKQGNTMRFISIRAK